MSNSVQEIPFSLRMFMLGDPPDSLSFVRQNVEDLSYEQLQSEKDKAEDVAKFLDNLPTNALCSRVTQVWRGKQQEYTYTELKYQSPDGLPSVRLKTSSFVVSRDLPPTDSSSVTIQVQQPLSSEGGLSQPSIFQRVIAALGNVWPF